MNANQEDKNSSNLQSRLRSPTLWLSVASLVAFTAKTYFNYEIPQLDTFVDMLLLVCAGFGIINNPTDKKGI